MEKPFLFYDDLVTASSEEGYVEKPRLTQLSAVFLLSLCVIAKQRNLWQNPIDTVDDDQWVEIQEMISDAEGDLMISFGIGSIIPSVADLDATYSLLRMDGQTVSQDDYPDLFEVVPTGWISGTDITLPDMDATSLHGDYSNAGDILGENTITLDVSEMPSHNHTQSPHTHIYNSPIVTPTGAGPIVGAASVVIPTPLATGLATPAIQSTGGDNPHDNVPLSMSVIHYIVAR